jgi:hypothetical protein
VVSLSLLLKPSMTPPRHQSPGIPDRYARLAADGKDQRHPGPPAGALDAAFDQHQLNRTPPAPESRPPVALRHQAEDVARLPVTILQPGEHICFRPASLASLPEDLRMLVHCRIARSTRLTFREQERLIRRTGRRPV